jgi:hypothetical protein
MKNIQRTRVMVLPALVLALGALAGCGSSATSSGSSGSPSPSASGPAASPPATAAMPSPSPTAQVPTPAVVSSRVTYPWRWPNDASRPGRVQHAYPVPPLPTLIAIGAGDHPSEPGERPYNRMSFTFTGAFPSYQFEFADTLVSDPSGRPVPLAGNGVLKVTFRQAQAHAASGRSSVVSQPPVRLGFSRMVSWRPAGDFEGVLTIGIGIAWPIPHSNPQFAVRALEVERVTAQGQHLYIVAIDIDATR